MAKYKYYEKVVRFSNKPQQVVYMDNVEYWEDICCYDIQPGRYEISTFGRVKDKLTGKIVPTFGANYDYVRLKCDGINNRPHNEGPFLIHRIMGYTFLMDQKRPDQNEINHKRGKKEGNHLNNIEWMSGEENEKHSQETGLVLKGEEVPTSVFTNEQVETICQMLQDGYNYEEILNAIDIPVTKTHRDDISNIKMGNTWQHISYKYDFSTALYGKSNYTEAQIRQICEMLQDGKTSREIYEVFYPDRPYTNQSDPEVSLFFQTLCCIRKRTRFKKISKDYNF